MVKKLSKLHVYIRTAMILSYFWLQILDGVLEIPAGEGVAQRPGLNTDKDDDTELDCSAHKTMIYMVTAEPMLLFIA